MTTYDIGEQFENFVSKKIFNSSAYTLVEKTHSYDQNSDRFVESSLNPDFKFRSTASGQEFYVEAKYRSNFNQDDMVELLKSTQLHRFKSLNSSDHPVFLIVGVGGSPSNPDILSFIPIADINYLDLYRSVILRHGIEKSSFPQSKIDNWVKVLFPEAPLKKHNAYTGTRRKDEWKVKPMYLGMSIIVMLLLIFGYKSILTTSTPSDGTLKSKIESYYDVLEHNNITLLDHYLNDKIDRWYDHSNVNAAFVLKNAEAYNQKFPIRQIDIEWPTYKEARLPNGDYNVSYYLIYKTKSNKQSEFKTYFLNIKAIWDKDFKLRSMYEERLN